MLETIEGVYRDGKIELLRTPRDVSGDTPVIVTFLASNSMNLRDRGIDEEQAAVLLASLTTFAEDWESPDGKVLRWMSMTTMTRLSSIG